LSYLNCNTLKCYLANQYTCICIHKTMILQQLNIFINPLLILKEATLYITITQRFLCSPNSFRGSILSPLCPSVQPSVRPGLNLLNLLSEIDVDINYSLRQGLVDQGLSRSLWEVQGHSEHTKKNPISTFLHITIKGIDTRSSETYTEFYRQYIIHNIRYDPRGQPYPQEPEIA
jgi:hypothetical protein